MENQTEGNGPTEQKSLGARFLEGVKKFFIGLFSIIILIVVVTMAVNWLFFSGNDKPKTQTTQAEQQAKTYSDTEAYVEAQFILEKFLKAPSTAKYPASSQASIERLKDNGFKVTSYVDSQNGFGAMIRSNWTVLFQYVGDKIKLYQVIIDGEEMYRTDDVE